MEAQVIDLKVDGRGRRDILDDREALIALLEKIKSGNYKLTHYMKHKLVDEGFLRIERIDPVGRGRPFEKPVLSTAGNRLISQAKATKASAIARSQRAADRRAGRA